MAGKSGAIRAGKAYYELYGEQSPLAGALKKGEALVRAAAAKVASVSKKALAAGLGIGAGIAAATKMYGDMGAELTDISRRTGASASALSSLGYAAQRSGSDINAVEGALTTMRDKIVDAARGSDQSQLAFARLGLNFMELARMKPEDAFRAIAAQLNKIPDPALRAAAAAEVLGTADLNPMISQLTELENRASELGLVMGDADAAAAKRFTNALADLWQSLKMVAVTIGGAVAPIIEEWAESILGAVKDWRSGIDKLIDKWFEWKTAIQTGAIDALYGVLEIANNVWASMRQGWEDFTNWFVNKWKAAQNAIAEKAIDLMALFDDSINPADAKATLTEDFQRAQQARDKGHADRSRQIEKERLSREDELAEQNRTANEGMREENHTELAATKSKIKALLTQLDDIKAGKGDAGKAPELGKSVAGIGGAVFHTQGIGAEDIRTSGGFSSLMKSLRLQGNPMAQLTTVQKQALQLQKDEAKDIKRTRLAIEKVTVVGK